MAITVPEPEARQAARAAVGTLHRRYRRDAALEFARAGSLERVLQSTGRRTAGVFRWRRGNYDTVPSGRALIVQVDDRSMRSPAN